MAMELLTECIEWQGARNYRRGGYGARSYQGRMMGAHRAAWIERYGSIPEGLQVLHRCDNPPCVNVEHLWLGSAADNARDMAQKGRGRNQNSGKTECVNGHKFSPENTYIYADGKKRHCWQCLRDRKARYRASIKASA